MTQISFIIQYDVLNTARHLYPDCLLLVGRQQLSDSGYKSYVSIKKWIQTPDAKPWHLELYNYLSISK